MMTEKAKQRAQVLTFWAKHGSEATKEAFKTEQDPLQNKTRPKRVQYVVAQYSPLHGWDVHGTVRRGRKTNG